MTEQTERRVFSALDSDGANLLTLCERTALFVADVVMALDRLIEQGWVTKHCELYFPVSPRKVTLASVDQVITGHLGKLNSE